ncbi:hypothetical protein NDU88_005306 [Pleurodeles waltl]|uniref:Uncharacterized protein n=1 Tax=Pleurodeles waltl TaxID=8319 RepID=A0AAV7PFJ9_PLEWA|nr:hypothetical protein NDU88_005306 [Pleurodeles waltl]
MATKTEGRRKETGETTSAVRQTEAPKERRRKGAKGTAGAGLTAASRRPAGRTMRVQQDATEGQKAIRPNSSHAQGRAWPQQCGHIARHCTLNKETEEPMEISMMRGLVMWSGHNQTKYTTRMRLNQVEKNVLIESGCSQSVVKRDYVRPDQWIPHAQVLITYVHGDRKTYPIATVSINRRGQEECLSVGVIPNLGEDMIIGMDYDAFAYLLVNSNQDHMTDSWWKEEAPSVSTDIEEHPVRRKLSKKKKREQKQGY